MKPEQHVPKRKNGKRKAKKTEKAPRLLRLHATFAPPGSPDNPGGESQNDFMQVFLEAEKRQSGKMEKRLRLQIKNLLQRTGHLPAATAAVAAEAAAPQEPGAAGNSTLSDEQMLVAHEQALRFVSVLAEGSQAGNKAAVEYLVRISRLAIAGVMAAEALHPEMTRKIAKRESAWPLLAVHPEPGWEKKAAERIERLQVGQDLEIFCTKFRRPRGADENYPARCWAKAAVRTLEETRLQLLLFHRVSTEIEELVLSGAVETEELPSWAKKACTLGPFAAGTVSAWAPVVREMIRQEAPAFHTAPEWKTQTATARHRGRDSTGEIQNAILDDIVSALHSIAPAAKMLKPDC